MACKIWHASDFILIFSKGNNSRKGDNSNKKKKRVSTIFPWGIHIWNFKTLACTVLDERTDTQMHGCTHRQPKTNMPCQLLQRWGHKKKIHVDKTCYYPETTHPQAESSSGSKFQPETQQSLVLYWNSESLVEISLSYIDTHDGTLLPQETEDLTRVLMYYWIY